MPRFSARKKNGDHMHLLVTYPRFLTGVEKLRREFGIPLQGFTSAEEYDLWLCNIANDPRPGRPFRRYLKALAHLRTSFKLPEHFLESIQRYVLFNTISSPLNNFDIGPIPATVRRGETPYVPVRVYAQLSEAEALDLRKEINLFARHLPNYQPLKKDLDRKLKNEQKLKELDAVNQEIDAANSRRPKSSKADKPYTLKELANGNARKVYEDIRILKKNRQKRFG